MSDVTVELHGNLIVIDAGYRDKDLIKTVPGRKYAAETKQWTVPLAWTSCHALRGIFKERLVIGPALAEWARDETERWIDPVRRLLAINAAGADTFGEALEEPFQRIGTQWLLTARHGLLADEMRLGKAERNGTPVLTPTGWTPIESLSSGDVVYAVDGSETKVSGVYPQGERDLLCVRFNDGTSATVDKDHLWEVTNIQNGWKDGPRVLSTSEILESGVSDGAKPRRSGGRSGNYKWKIPLCAPIQHRSIDLPLSPYLLGLLLGDGGMSQNAVYFTTADPELIQVVNEILPGVLQAKRTSLYTYRLVGDGGPNPLVRALKDLSLMGTTSGTKFIPEMYLIAHEEARRALLAGLLDTDGSISNQTIEFTSKSKALTDGVVSLVRSLGGEARTRKKVLKSGPYAGNIYWRCNIIMDVCPFRLQRKIGIWRPRERVGPKRIITSIEPAGRGEATCIAVEHPQGLFISDDYIVTHNTIQVAVALRDLPYRLSLTSESPFPPLLVVCPNSVKRNWLKELSKWAPRLRFEIVKGTAVQRRKTFERLDAKELDGIIVHWEALRLHSRLAPYGSIALNEKERTPGELNRSWSVVIADEAHRAKDPKAKQTRALWAASADAEYRWALTGTPIAKAPDDLWSILHFIQPEEWPAKSRFIERYCNLAWNPFGAMEVNGLKIENEAELRKTLDLRMLRRTQKEVHLHTPSENMTRYAELSPKERKAYNTMRDTFLTELDSGDQVIGWNPLTQLTRLLQLSSATLVMEGETVQLTDPSSKLDVLMETLDDLGDEQVVIVSPSRKLVQLAAARLEKANISHGQIHGGINVDDRADYIDAFQAGKLRAMLLQSKAGGEGITLNAASTMIFLNRPMSMVEDTQVSARIGGYGQAAETLLYIDIVTADTAEERVFELLIEKRENLEEVVRDRARLKELIA